MLRRTTCSPWPLLNRDDQKAANLGKIELVDEMLAAAEADFRLMFPDDDEEVIQRDLIDQEERLTETIEKQQTVLAGWQSELDRLRRERRDTIEARDAHQSRSDEIKMTQGGATRWW